VMSFRARKSCTATRGEMDVSIGVILTKSYVTKTRLTKSPRFILSWENKVWTLSQS